MPSESKEIPGIVELNTHRSHVRDSCISIHTNDELTSWEVDQNSHSFFLIHSHAAQSRHVCGSRLHHFTEMSNAPRSSIGNQLHSYRRSDLIDWLQIETHPRSTAIDGV